MRVWSLVVCKETQNALWGAWWLVSFRGTCSAFGRLSDMGKPLPLFAVVELGEVVLHGWKPRLWAFVKLRGTFRGLWKLERLVWARKTLGLWCVWKLRVLLGIGGNFGVVFFGA